MGPASSAVLTGQLSALAPGSRRRPALRYARQVAVPAGESGPTTFLVFLAASARTRIVASNFPFDDRLRIFRHAGFIGKEHGPNPTQHQPLVERNLRQRFFISPEAAQLVLDLVEECLDAAARGLTGNRKSVSE